MPNLFFDTSILHSTQRSALRFHILTCSLYQWISLRRIIIYNLLAGRIWVKYLPDQVKEHFETYLTISQNVMHLPHIMEHLLTFSKKLANSETTSCVFFFLAVTAISSMVSCKNFAIWILTFNCFFLFSSCTQTKLKKGHRRKFLLFCQLSRKLIQYKMHDVHLDKKNKNSSQYSLFEIQKWGDNFLSALFNSLHAEIQNIHEDITVSNCWTLLIFLVMREKWVFKPFWKCMSNANTIHNTFLDLSSNVLGSIFGKSLTATGSMNSINGISKNTKNGTKRKMSEAVRRN